MTKLKIKIKNEKIPHYEGLALYLNDIKVHVGVFTSLDALREFWYCYLVENNYWSCRHDLSDVLTGQNGDYFFRCLKEFPTPPYHVYTWERDCDMCESSNVRKVSTYIDLIKNYRSWLNGYEWAEGPRSWQLVEPQLEESHSRDRALQAFENGRGDSIYC